MLKSVHKDVMEGRTDSSVSISLPNFVGARIMRSDWSLIDIGGIVNHQCLIFLFIINLYLDISNTVLSYYKNCQREHNTHGNQLLTDNR